MRHLAILFSILNLSAQNTSSATGVRVLFKNDIHHVQLCDSASCKPETTAARDCDHFMNEWGSAFNITTLIATALLSTITVMSFSRATAAPVKHAVAPPAVTAANLSAK